MSNAPEGTRSAPGIPEMSCVARTKLRIRFARMLSPFLATVTAILALAFAGCTEGAASYVLTKREKTSTTWLDQQQDQLVCRVNQGDIGYTGSLALKIPIHDGRKEQLDCHQMVEAQRSALMSAKSTPIFDPGLVLLGGAAQWMLAHPDVHQ